VHFTDGKEWLCNKQTLAIKIVCHFTYSSKNGCINMLQHSCCCWGDVSLHVLVEDDCSADFGFTKTYGCYEPLIGSRTLPVKCYHQHAAAMNGITLTLCLVPVG